MTTSPSLQFDAPFRPDGPDFNPLAVETRDIVEWLQERQPLSIGRWDSIGSEEYARSFTVARSMGSDIVADIYSELQRTFDERLGEEDFASRIIPIMREKGWLSSDNERAWRAHIIFDTNLRIARAQGKWARIVRGSNRRPYLEYDAVNDSRTRPSHAALDGVILPVSHPFWRRHYPPWDFQCRCSAITLAPRDLARRNLQVTSDGELAERLSMVEDEEGFGTSPAIAGYEENIRQIAEQANARRIPSAPAIEPVETRTRGRSMWLQAIGQLLLQILLRRGENANGGA